MAPEGGSGSMTTINVSNMTPRERADAAIKAEK